MAVRKKTPGGAEFTVVLEEMRAQFKVFGEALAGFREETERRFERVDADLTLLKTATLETSREIREVRAESRAGLDAVRTELRTGLDGVRTELRTGLADVRTEIRALRSDFRDVRADLDEVRARS